jgi:hypothetical protein
MDSEINRSCQWLKEQENSYQLMIANQPTLELKFDKLEQIKVNIFTKKIIFRMFAFL